MKTLQKTLAAIFALLAIALFAACSSDSADSADSDDDFAGTLWSYSYEYFDEDYDVYPAVRTLYFQSGGNVAVLEYMDSELSGAENGTYSASGSTVTLNLDETGAIELAYSSGELIYYTSMGFTLDGSTSLETFSASGLAGTTWKYEYADSEGTYDEISFGEDGKSFTAVYYADGSEEYTDSDGIYSVDGTTVTVNYEDRPQTRFIYSDGKLVLLWVFTKDGEI